MGGIESLSKYVVLDMENRDWITENALHRSETTVEDGDGNEKKRRDPTVRETTRWL